MAITKLNYEDHFQVLLNFQCQLEKVAFMLWEITLSYFTALLLSSYCTLLTYYPYNLLALDIYLLLHLQVMIKNTILQKGTRCSYVVQSVIHLQILKNLSIFFIST